MSLLWASSVTRYVTADAAAEFTGLGSGVTIVASQSPSGGSIVRSPNVGNTGQIIIGVAAVGSTGYLLVRWRGNSLVSWSNQSLIQIRRSNVAMLSIKPTSAGAIAVYRGLVSTGVLLGTSAAGLVADNNFSQLQVKFTIDDTAGVVEILLNGGTTPILSLTAQDTNNAGDGNWDEIRFTDHTVGPNVAIQNDFCDIAIMDAVDATATQGQAFNGYLGDVTIRPHFANGAGNSAAWTRYGTDSGANWSQTDEATANGDTDGVKTTTVGNRDTYAMQDLKSTGQTILGVVPVAQIKKTDAGSAAVGPSFRYSGVDYDPANGIVPSTAYAFRQMLNGTWVGLHPSGVAWTETNFNATESGPYKVV